MYKKGPDGYRKFKELENNLQRYNKYKGIKKKKGPEGYQKFRELETKNTHRYQKVPEIIEIRLYPQQKEKPEKTPK